MQITVFGANGRVGARVVRDAVSRGHSVRAFVHTNDHKLQFDDQVEVVRGDACNADDVKWVIANCDVVINALGSWGTKTKDIQKRAMQAIIPHMQQSGISRIVSLTGAEARAATDKISIRERLNHTIFKLFASKILHDGQAHLRLLEQSTLDWTVVRSPAMTNSGNGSSYKFIARRPGLVATIRRDSVAKAMVDLAETQSYVHQAPFLGRVK